MIVVSRILTGTDEWGDATPVTPGRYLFVDELGRAGRDLRTVIQVDDVFVGIAEADYPHIRQL
jgi:hypothetical protein